MRLEHQYNTIGGWFNFQDIYSHMVTYFDKGHFVEIGTFMGKSASFMGVEIINSGKPIIFDTIDTFEGSPEEINGKHSIYNKIDIKERAVNNLKNIPVNIINCDSLSVAKSHMEESLEFVFIDGAHDYTSVLNDIKAWYPKIKKGGYIGGHDYDNENVKMAVDKYFDNFHCPKSINSWLIQK